MAEEEIVYQSKVKYNGVFSFKDVYKFAYDWLSEETGLSVKEGKYEEKIAGNAKNITAEWIADKKISDYFKNKASITIKTTNMEDVEVMDGGAKIKVNKGGFELSVKGSLIRDYDSKWEVSPFKKFMRGIYERYVIPSQVEQYKDKFSGQIDDFVSQMKAYFALEGKK